MADVFVSVDTWNFHDDGSCKRVASFPVGSVEEADEVAIFFVAHKLVDVVQIVQHNPHFVLTEWNNEGEGEYTLYGYLPTQMI